MLGYTYTQHNTTESLMILLDTGAPLTVGGSHPMFDRIVDYVKNDPDPTDAHIQELADTTTQIKADLRRISPRVTFDGTQVRFDGAVVNNALTRHLLRLLRAGQPCTPIALFMERLALNPDANIRHRLWEWLESNDFTITTDGHVVGYKSVEGDRNLSIHSGVEPITVGNTVHTGRIPYPIGVPVTMPRNLVDSSRLRGCSVGLHVGTWDYAATFNGDRILTVEFDPADVVSIPSEDCRKLRVCRLMATGVTLRKIDEPLIPAYLTDEDEDEDGEAYTDYETYDQPYTDYA